MPSNAQSFISNNSKRMLEEEKHAHSGQWGASIVALNGEKMRQGEAIKKLP